MPRTQTDTSKERLALAQRRANAVAARLGASVPFPNPWDALDPTKLPRDATAEMIAERYRKFSALCRTKPRTRHIL